MRTQYTSISSKFSGNYSQTLIIWATIIVAFCFFSFFYNDSIKTLFKYWNDYGTYSHGYLTILLSVFLIYTCVRNGRFQYSGPSIISIVCLVVISLVWLLAYVSSVNTVQMLCLPLFVFFTITHFIGLNNVRVLLIPILILLFTIPIWSPTLPALQDIAVFVTNQLLSISSLDYRVVGNKVIFSKGIFEIEESCSGLRYLLVGVLLSSVYGFLNYKSIWSTLVLVLVAIAIMLIGNFIRILTVIGLGVIKGLDYPLVQDHANLGWVLFALLLLPLFITANYINPSLGQKTDIEESHLDNKEGSVDFPKFLLMFASYLMVVSAAPLYANHLKDSVINMASLKSSSIQLDADWRRSELLSSKWAPSYSSYSEGFSEQYTKSEKTIALNAFLYTKQLPRGELINANNKLVDKNKWSVSDSSRHQVIMDKAGSNSAVVNMLTIQSIQEKDCLRIWYWFEVDDAAYTKQWQVKLNEALMSFKGGSGSAIISISTDCGNNPDIILNDFLFANFTQIKKMINW